ncbi:uncharacterized protein [Asterias amurensis]|uniref:uncharacterized protein n=1 Tax=Asterias amurensis TaxID=7602 RepID=UPI003AB1AC58
MKTCALLFVVVMATVVMTVAAMEDESDDWFENLLQEYKRRPKPPPRGPAQNGKQMPDRSVLEQIKRTCETSSPRGALRSNCIKTLLRPYFEPLSCLGYGKSCTITNRQNNCCRGLGCYAGSGNDCVGSRNCVCRKTPELKYVYYMV